MKLTTLISQINILTDEDLPPSEVEGFVNDAIARINADAGANFPFLSLTTDEEPAFPENWQRLLIIPYASARVKQKDSSQFEYIDLYSEFERNLTLFLSRYTIPEEFKDPNTQTSYDGNYDGTYWGGDW